MHVSSFRYFLIWSNAKKNLFSKKIDFQKSFVEWRRTVVRPPKVDTYRSMDQLITKFVSWDEHRYPLVRSQFSRFKE